MTVLCFVDANLFVYSINSAEPLKQQVAAKLIDSLWREQRARTSIQVLNEFYTVVTRKLHRSLAQDKAWLLLEQVMQWDPQPIDTAVLLRGRSIELRYRLNWWDCLIVAAAQLQHCSVLYTEDLQHGASFGDVKVADPFQTRVQEELAPYRTQVVSPHRPRGRPRRQVA